MSTKAHPQVPISALPLASHTLQNSLLPIPIKHRGQPSSQRRSQNFSKTGSWARVTPLPVMFPYRVPKAGEGEEQVGIEAYLGAWDDWQEVASVAPDESGSSDQSRPRTFHIKPYTSKLRQTALPETELIALSASCLQDQLPHLSVGNALEYVTRSGEGILASESTIKLDSDGQDLLDVLSGKQVLLSLPSTPSPFSASSSEHATLSERDPEFNVNQLGLLEETWESSNGKGYGGYGPWSMRYAGHQFGSWAGQLGDGRATSLLETETPEKSRVELQLKGAGRTPFSRSADGLAVLRSGIREFLGAEAVAALRIPTTRSLALLTHSEDEMVVGRENGAEPSSLLCRTAPSFLRVGNFEVLNPPEEAMNMQFFMMGRAGGASRGLERDWEGLRRLGEWVAGPGGLDLPIEKGRAWGWELVKEVARRNAVMVAGWQVYGFCHGVMNTDNISVLGLTIDYGPYAFMDVYDPHHICNHSDHEGRYDYRKQPTMILYAMRSLHATLAEVIGCEESNAGTAIGRGWAEDEDESAIEEWNQAGHAHDDELEKLVMTTFREEYKRLYLQRFGLATDHPKDLSEIVDPFLTFMKDHDLDFHATLRALCFFKPSLMAVENEAVMEAFLIRIVANMPRGTQDKREAAKEAIRPWLRVFSDRVLSEQNEWNAFEGGDWEIVRQANMRQYNPRFVLRQWVLEETIKQVSTATGAEKRTKLSEILAMAAKPFESYAEDAMEGDELSGRQVEEQRLCGLGSVAMLGYTCSCSS